MPTALLAAMPQATRALRTRSRSLSSIAGKRWAHAIMPRPRCSMPSRPPCAIPRSSLSNWRCASMSAADRYPLAEDDLERVHSRSGRTLGDVSVEAIVAGKVAIEELAIAPEGLRAQAEIARAVGRPTLARNFDRAAELVTVPEALLLRVYELLRPGRAMDRE